MKFYDVFVNFLNEYQSPLVVALQKCTTQLEARPDKIHNVVKKFNHLQKAKLKEGEQRATLCLDTKDIVRTSRKQLRASVLKL
ncbi:hypothetical protein IAR55_002528 [Kwoniella newhampshirensis]|uniref:Uncharacterized protein n=1 Tax=Kwoniella newhampshirensis TaxID=1651941 RepID=A0AAW0Z1P6_9TREE